MFCKKCGTQLEDDAIFCNKCGTKISGTTPPPVISSQKNAIAQTSKWHEEEKSAKQLATIVYVASSAIIWLFFLFCTFNIDLIFDLTLPIKGNWRKIISEESSGAAVSAAFLALLALAIDYLVDYYLAKKKRTFSQHKQQKYAGIFTWSIALAGLLIMNATEYEIKFSATALCLVIFCLISSVINAVLYSRAAKAEEIAMTQENKEVKTPLLERLKPRSATHDELEEFWICKKCGRTNERLQSFCKDCGTYK